MCGMKSSAIWVAAAAIAPWAAGAVEVSGASLAVTLDEQAKDPLPRKKSEKSFDLGDYVPFTKDPEYIRRKQNRTQQ